MTVRFNLTESLVVGLLIVVAAGVAHAAMTRPLGAAFAILGTAVPAAVAGGVILWLATRR